ncbi:hypothetical protein BDW59DRAFT_155614 [Aspergillus cavernicola]|uniref:Fungal-type protein kinase domain-containing protein n=1 Tax=Aspergillus cavernicola TaxID=176166 RepID=A0ABR4H7K4_9EURO
MADNNRPIRSLEELEVFLKWWVDENGMMLGNVHAIWELVRILKLDKPQSLLQRLEKIKNCRTDDKAARSRDHKHTHVSLPSTLATYLIEDIESSEECATKGNQLLHNKSGDDLMRYKIEVMRDSFLWLDDILGMTSNWFQVFIGSPCLEEQLSHDIMETRHFCIAQLTTERTRHFWKERGSLREYELKALDGLWELFKDNGEIPIKHIFCLAVAGAKGSWPDKLAWSKFYAIVNPLL